MSSIDTTLNSLSESNTTDDVFGLFIQFLVASITGIVAIVAFTVLRPKNKKVYQPNFYVLDQDKQPPKLSYSFKWIMELIRIDDETIVKSSGVDGLLTIKVLRMFFNIFIILTPVCLIILVPIHLTQKANNVDPKSLSAISVLSLTKSPNYLYAHTAIMYFIALVVFYFTVNMWNTYILIRQKYVHDYYNQAKTVFYTGVVHNKKPHAIDQHVYNKYNLPCTGILLNDPSNLIKLFDRYNNKLSKLEIFCHEHPDRPEEALRMIEGLKTIKNQINEEQHRGMTSINYLPSGFGIFRTPKDAYSASKKSLLRSSEYTPYHAVDVKDILWNNVKMGPAEIKSRRMLGRVLTFALVCFWLIPIIFLTPLTDLTTLSKYLPFVVTLINDYPKLAAVIQAVLTPLLLKLLLIFIPDIFYAIASLQAEPTNTEVQKSTLRKLFAFFIVGYYLLFTLSSSVWTLYSRLSDINSVSSGYSVFQQMIVNIGYAVSKQGIYWINWMTLNGPGILYSYRKYPYRFGSFYSIFVDQV